MFEKLYNTCELLSVVTLALFIVSILTLMADPFSDRLFRFLMSLTGGFLTLVSLLFFGTLLADIWI